MANKTFQDGLIAAARLLNDTADDFEEIRERYDKMAGRTPVEMAERRSLVDRVAILRGQAKLVLELK